MRTKKLRPGCHWKAVLSIALIGSLALACPSLAKPPADDASPEAKEPKGPPDGAKIKGERGRRGDKQAQPRRGEMRKKMLKKFDQDQDGELNEAERKSLREFMQKRRAEQGDRFGREGDFRRGPGAGGPPEGRGDGRRANRSRRGPGFGGPGADRSRTGPAHEGRSPRYRQGHRGFDGDRPTHLGQARGSQARGSQQAGGGHGGPPNLGMLFKRMDQDEDGKLDQKEFAVGMKRLRQMHRSDSTARRPGRSDGARKGQPRRGRGGDGFRQGPPDGDGPRFQGNRRPDREHQFRGPGKRGKPGAAGPHRRQRPEGTPEETKSVEQDATDAAAVE
jgi:hypothetical protein